MRSPHTLMSCGPMPSPGCLAWTSGQAPTIAATGASTRPIPSEIGSRTGSTARTPITSAPASATHRITSMLSTQRTVAVERATVMVSRITSTADQKRPPPMDSRTRSQSKTCGLSRNASSGLTSRPLGDTYRIPCPHQASEVVTPPHDVEVDVLAQVEARVLVRAAKARGVDVEHDQAGAPAAYGLQQVHPRGVRAGRDDRDGTPWQAADAVPRQRVGQRRAAIRLADGKVVEDEPVLAHSSVRLEHGAARIVADEADLAATAVHLGGHRGGEADRVLDGRLLPLAEMDAAVKVEQDPQVGRQGLLESLRHQALVLRRERPVDAAEAVARVVVAHTAGLRRVVCPGAECLRGADLLRAGRQEVGDRPDARVDEDRGRAQRHPTAAAVDAPGLPPHHILAEGDHAPRLIVRDLAQIAYLDPRRRDPALAM